MTLSDRDIFASYVADRRHQSIELFRSEQFAHLLRYTPITEGIDGFVTFSQLDPVGALTQIQEQIDYFKIALAGMPL